MARDVRASMIRSAALLFRERGVAGTSLADVVEHSGAPRGSIYHHFPGGKEQLATEATAWAGRAMGRLIGKGGDDPVVVVRTLFEFWRGELGRDFRVSCPVVAAAVAEPEGVHQAAGKVFAAWQSAIAELLTKRGVAAGRAESVATLLITAVEGAVVMARAQRDTGPLDRVEGELTRLIGHLLVDVT